MDHFLENQCNEKKQPTAVQLAAHARAAHARLARDAIIVDMQTYVHVIVYEASLSPALLLAWLVQP